MPRDLFEEFGVSPANTSESGEPIDLFEAFDVKPKEPATWGKTFVGLGNMLGEVGTSSAGGMLQSSGERGIAQARADIENPEGRIKRQMLRRGGPLGIDVGRSVRQIQNPEQEAAKAKAEAEDELPVMERRAGIGRDMFEQSAKRQEEIRPDFSSKDWGKEYVFDLGVAAEKMVPPLVVGAVTRSPLMAAGAMGPTVYGDTYGHRRMQGRSVREANQDAIVSTAIELGTELPVFGQLFKFGKPGLKKILNTTALEGVSESVSSLLQTAYDAGVVDDNMTLGEAFTSAKTYQDAAYEGLIGAGLGGMMGGAMIPANMRSERQAIEQIKDITANMQFEVMSDTALEGVIESGEKLAKEHGDTDLVQMIDVLKAEQQVRSENRVEERQTQPEPTKPEESVAASQQVEELPQVDESGVSLTDVQLPESDAGLNTADAEAGYQVVSPIKEAGIGRIEDEPTPEKPESLQAQLTAFEEGRKPAVLLTPGESVPALPEDAQIAQVPGRGLLIYKDPKILDLALNDRMGEALGYGISEKPVSDQVVTARDETGQVVQDVLTDGSQEVVEAAEQVAGPKGTVETRPAMEALQERHENNDSEIVAEKPSISATEVPQAKAEKKDNQAVLEEKSFLKGNESASLAENLETGAKKSKTFDQYKSWANGFFGRNKARMLSKRLEKTWKQHNGNISDTDTKIDDKANEAATSRKNDTPAPTEAQKKAGNYKVGKLSLHGLDISIENPKDSTRSGKDSDGKEWKTKMAHHYGYIKGKGEAADGDHPDVFLGPNAENAELPVFVVDQIDPKTKTFDEHKALIGFKNKLAAKKGYLQNYQKGWKGAGAVNQMSIDEFRAWLDSGDTKSPISFKEKKKLIPKRERIQPDKSPAPGKAKKDSIQEDSATQSKKEPKPAAEATTKTEKIEDFGEKLEGARKDTWQAYEQKSAESKEVDIKTSPLSKSWPEPDYQKMVDEGADPWVVGFMRSVRDEVPTKPRAKWKVSGWVDQVKMLRNLAYDILENPELADKAKAELQKKDILKQIKGRIELYQEVGHGISLKGIKFLERHFSIYHGEENVNKWIVEKKAKASAFSNWPKEIAVGNTREEAIDNFKLAVSSGALDNQKKSKSIRFDIYRYPDGAKNGKWFVGKKIGRDHVDLEEFDDPKEARAYLNENEDKLAAKLARFKEIPDSRKENNSPRVGTDYRNGADVTAEQFSESFGFRGVQFGNYVEGAKRQQDLNEAYDALMDLAGVLDVPAKTLSLNGELGLAFGARGKGAAGHGKGNVPKAHYESGHIVINLTKKEGAGSLAHEWWHSLDNYFSRSRNDKDNYLTERAYLRGEGVRPEMIEAFNQVTKAIGRTRLKQRSSVLDRPRSKEYWTTGREMSARAFESYVIEKLKDQNASNDYLANIVSEDYWNAASALGLEKEGSYPYPEAAEIPEIRAAYDNFFKVAETKETEKGVAIFSKKGPDVFSPDTAEAEFFRKKLQSWSRLQGSARNSGRPLVVGSTPAVMQAFGVPDLKIQIDKPTLIKVNRESHDSGKAHGITIEQLGQLPEVLSDPVAVFKSKTKGFVVLTELLADGGKPVMVAIHVGKRVGRHSINDISSMYARPATQYENWVKEGRLRYYNNEKSPGWKLPVPLQLRAGRASSTQSFDGEPSKKMTNRLQSPYVSASTTGSTKRIYTPEDVVNWAKDKKPLVFSKANSEEGKEKQEDSQISAGHLSDTIDNLVEQLGHKPPVRVIERVSEVLPDSAKDDIATGFVRDGRIHIVRPNIPDASTAVKTLWHELLHYGVRRFLTKDQYVSEMLNLYERDAWVKRYANRWRLGKEGRDLRKEGHDKDYIKARGVDEALAELGETVGGTETGFQKTDPVAQAIRAVVRWMAKLADTLGFKEAASWIRGLTSEEARLYVHSIYGKLKEDAPATVDDWAFTADPAFMISIKKKSKTPKISGGREYTSEQREAIKKGGFKKGQVAEFSEKMKTAQENLSTKIRQGMVDQYASFKDILNDNRSWMMAQLTGSSTGAVEVAIDYGVPYMEGGAIAVDTKQKSLKEILEPLGVELDDWLAWMAGNRAEKLKEQDKERLFSDVDIDALKSLNKGQMKDGSYRYGVYNSVRKEFESMNAAINQIGVDTGLISEQEAKIWKDQGFYVPFYRVLSEEEGVRGPRIFSDGLVRQNAYKKLKGADIPLNDLLGNILMNWSHIVGASLRNQTASSALESAEKMGLASEVTPAAKSKNAIWVRRDGKQVWYDLDSSQEGQLVLNSLMSLNWSGLNNFAFKAMRKFKRLFTMGVTVNPEFRIANLLRDSLHSIAVVDMDTNIAKNIAKGWKSTSKKSEAYAKMIAGGGAFGNSGYIHGADPDVIRKVISKGVSRETILTKNYLSKLWGKYEDFGARMENINRAAAFEKSLRDGKNLLEANFEARDLLDFSRTGSFTAVRALAQVVPFLNARLQGLDKMGRALADKKQRKQFMAVVGVYSLASVALYLSMKDDDDYKDAEDWERDAYHLFKLPGSDIMYRLPRPFEVGLIATLLERGVEQAVDDEVHGKLFAERLFHGVKDTLSINPVPQAFMPVVELYANKNTFTGRNIETMGMERMSPAERKKVWTSQTAISISEGMDNISWGKVVLSPVQIEHLVNGYLGWAGASVLAATDRLISEPLAETPSSPSKKITDYPVIKRFAREGEGRHSKYMTQFYDNLKEVTQAYGDLKQAREFQDLEKEREILEESGNKLRYRKFYNKVQRRLSKIRKLMARVKLSKNLSPDQKREELDRLQRRLNKEAKLVVQRTAEGF